jgi:hypothetical protein
MAKSKAVILNSMAGASFADLYSLTFISESAKWVTFCCPKLSERPRVAGPAANAAGAGC